MPDRGSYDLIGKSKLWFAISGTLIGIGLIFMFLNTVSPQLNYGRKYPMKLGIDFTGGNIFKLVYDADYSTDITDKVALQGDIHKLVDKMTRTVPVVQAGKNEEGNLVIQVRTDANVTEENKVDEVKANVLSVVQKYKPDAKLIDESLDYVGPVIGRELAYRGVLGLVMGSALILFYVSLRMSFDFAVCAVVALIHDILILCGVFAVTRLEIDSSFVAAILTVTGYSVNDTIIIFDRIRENLGLKKGMPFGDLVNLSLVQTMPRSINTTLTTVLPIITLILFGGSSINHFMIALFVGISTGAYSSIFNASPLLVVWRQSKKRKSLAAKELAYGVASGTKNVTVRTPKATAVMNEPDVKESLEALEAEEEEVDEEQARSTYGPGKAVHKAKKKKRKR